jgi:hypothetical protein
MNKLNLPAPFGPQKKHAKSVHQGRRPKRIRTSVAAQEDTDLSTDESELESDAEVPHQQLDLYRLLLVTAWLTNPIVKEEMVQEQIELISSAVHAFQKVPAPALPTSKKHDTIQIKLGSTSTATAPADAPAEDASTETTASSATDTTEQPMTEPSSARPLTLEELAANRMPVSRTPVATLA